MTNRELVMVGAFPPPVHGMAVVNAAVLRHVTNAEGTAPLVINIAAPGLSRSTFSRFVRPFRVVRGLIRLARARGLRGSKLYMSASGGLGQLYEILFLVLARYRGMAVYVHHHSFAYLDRPSWATDQLAKAAGAAATHIALSPGMATLLSRLYPTIQRTVAVSNAFFSIPCAKRSRPVARARLRTLAYLGNISPQKGIFDFLELLDATQRKNLPLRGKIAGPFQDESVRRQVYARLAALRNVEYVGPKYDIEKEAFLDQIDALVFPTRYANEADPLVVHEAMRRGVPVIAYDRGAIGEVVHPSCGATIPRKGPFVPLALTYLEKWAEDGDLFQAISRSAIERFDALRLESEKHWKGLLSELIGSSSDEQMFQSDH